MSVMANVKPELKPRKTEESATLASSERNKLHHLPYQHI